MFVDKCLSCMSRATDVPTAAMQKWWLTASRAVLDIVCSSTRRRLMWEYPIARAMHARGRIFAGTTEIMKETSRGH